MGLGTWERKALRTKKESPRDQETVTSCCCCMDVLLFMPFFIMKPFSVFQNSKFYLGEEETFFIAFCLRLSTFKSNNLTKRWSSGGHFLHRCKGCRNPVHYQSIVVRTPAAAAPNPPCRTPAWRLIGYGPPEPFTSFRAWTLCEADQRC